MQVEEVDRRTNRVHEAVLVREVLDALERGLGADPTGVVLDATVGAGGHASAVLARFPRLRVLGCDWDPDSLAEAQRTLAPFGERVELVRAPFAEIEATNAHREPPVAVVADLGVCSLHFDRPERGFSLQADGPLDMRMDPTTDLTAADVVNGWSENELADLFHQEGGERKSRRIAAMIVEERRRVPFKRTQALADAIERVLGRRGKTHPATRTFQALRRAVNHEGEQLASLLAGAEHVLRPGGVLAVITFHSGEDGVVKRFLACGVREHRFESIGADGVEPTRREVHENARARSARLRAARFVGDGRGRRATGGDA
ncbi:MAG: 16S rRNA (cytosine(1402)-N(4))-methyltransferase RsmH [Planctomycetota bacterium]